MRDRSWMRLKGRMSYRAPGFRERWAVVRIFAFGAALRRRVQGLRGFHRPDVSEGGTMFKTGELVEVVSGEYAGLEGEVVAAYHGGYYDIEDGGGDLHQDVRESDMEYV